MTAAKKIQTGPSILDALNDPQLFGDTFTGPSWDTWRAVEAGAFALPMTDEQAETFKRLSGGREPPAKRVRELHVLAGRRSGKTQLWVATAVYIGTIGAAVDGSLNKLSTGERGVIGILANDRAQSKVAMRYARGLIESSQILSSMVERVNSESIDLTNGVSIEVQTSSLRAPRGRTYIALLFDEASYWRSDTSANPDVEIYRAAVPALATTGGMLIAISSPYSKRGLMYEKWKKHYGQDGDVLVIQGETRDFNPTIPDSLIQSALEDDPEAAKSEWLGQFRSDIASFIQREQVEACTRPGPLEVGHDKKRRYAAFVDPAGGGRDEFCLAIGHLEGERVIVDCLRASRGVPAVIAGEFAGALKSYGLRTVTGDRYAGSWPGDEFQKHGIKYHTSNKPKSSLYVELLPRINSERIELPPDQRLIGQLTNLERRTSRAGKDSIDHPPGMHDDRANVIAGVAEVVGTQNRNISVTSVMSGGHF